MQVKNIADLKRLPIGTRLYLIRNMLGPCNPSLRTIQRPRNGGIVLRVEDPDHVHKGAESFLPLSKAKFRATDGGFAILQNGEVAAEYRFDTGEQK